MKFPTKMYLDGTLADGQGKLMVTNPANKEKVATVEAAGLQDVHKAFEAACDTFPLWSKTSIAERQHWMSQADLDRGHLFAPTVLGDVDCSMDVYNEETFGPIVSIIPFVSENGLLEKANDCDDGGLTAYIFTENLAKAQRYATGLRYGEKQINGVKYDIDLPHGGIGQSGIGHDCSYLALNDYLILKRVTRSLEGKAA